MTTSIAREILFEIKRAKNIVFFTGADISKEAGLATFYNPGNEWEKYDISVLSSLQGFKANPDIVWKWYQHRRRSVAQHGSTKTHTLITDLIKLLGKGHVITQNVDCLHQVSGTKNLIELHGNIFHSKCSNCDRPYSEYTIMSDDPQRCKVCNSPIRPCVTWFGEEVETSNYNKSVELVTNADVLVTIGLYQEMEPAPRLLEMAHRSKTYIIEISSAKSVNERFINKFIHGRYSAVLENLIKDYTRLFIDI